MLHLRNCKIGDQGAFALANIISGNSTMSDLEIFNCGISEKGGNAIGVALENNFVIEKLSIGDNKLSVKDVGQI